MPDERILRYASIGIEDPTAAFGDARALDLPDDSDEFIDIDIASASLDTPDDTVLNYDGGLSRTVHTHRPGPYIPDGDLEYGFDIKTIFHLLYLVFGDVTQTAEPNEEQDLYEYEFTPLRHSLILPSATTLLGKDHFEHRFQGCTVNELTIQIDDEFAMVTADIVAHSDSKNDIRDIEDLELSEAYPIAFYEASIEIGEEGETQTSYDAEVESMELTITNNTDAAAGVGLGSRFPDRIIAGDFEVTANLDIAFEDTTHLEHFWGDAAAPTDELQDIMNVNLIFESAPYEEGEETIEGAKLDFHMPHVLYQTINLEPSGRDRMVQSVDMMAYYDEDSDYEILADLSNNVDYTTDYAHIEFSD